MDASINQVIIAGLAYTKPNLTLDDGIDEAKFKVVCTDDTKERTIINCVAYKKLALALEMEINRGTFIVIYGSLKSNEIEIEGKIRVINYVLVNSFTVGSRVKEHIDPKNADLFKKLYSEEAKQKRLQKYKKGV